ncbi:MAG: GldG family protein, partial [Myxococcota bacterium]
MLEALNHVPCMFWGAAAKSSLSAAQPYLIMALVAVVVAVGCIVLWRTTFDLSDEQQKRESRFWGLGIGFFGLFLFVVGIFSYNIIGVVTTRVALLEGLALGLLIGMYAVGAFSFAKTTSKQTALLGSASFLSLLGAGAGLAAINYVAYTNPKKFDLNRGQLFSLAPQTVKVLKNLKEPVYVAGFFRKKGFEQRYQQAVRSLLEKYSDINRSKFRFQFYDPVEHPELVSCFGITDTGVGQEGLKKRLIMYRGKCVPNKKKAGKGLTQSELVFQGKKLLFERVPPQERDLTDKMVKLTRKSKKVCFASGRSQPTLKDAGPNGLSGLKKILEDIGFETLSLDLFSKPEIPKDCDVVVQASPDTNTLRRSKIATVKFTEPEIEVFRRYLEGGGKLLVMQEPMVETGLEPLLKQYGVNVGGGLVLEFWYYDPRFGGPLSPIAGAYPDKHPITKGFRLRRQSLFGLATRVEPISAGKDVSTQKLVATNMFRPVPPKCCSFYLPNPSIAKVSSVLRAAQALKKRAMAARVAMGLRREFPKAENGPVTIGV